MRRCSSAVHKLFSAVWEGSSAVWKCLVICVEVLPQLCGNVPWTVWKSFLSCCRNVSWTLCKCFFMRNGFRPCMNVPQLFVSLQLYMDVPQLCTNVPHLCVHVLQICMNVPQLCVHVLQPCMNVPHLCVNVLQLCSNVPKLCWNVSQLFGNVSELCGNVPQLWESTSSASRNIPQLHVTKCFQLWRNVSSSLSEWSSALKECSSAGVSQPSGDVLSGVKCFLMQLVGNMCWML